jgi:hypothetical protein
MDPLAIIALISGIVSVPAWFCCYLGLPFGLASVICGIISIFRIKKEPQRLSGTGLAIGGIASSVVGVLIMGVILLIYGVAIIAGAP